MARQSWGKFDKIRVAVSSPNCTRLKRVPGVERQQVQRENILAFVQRVAYIILLDVLLYCFHVFFAFPPLDNKVELDLITAPTRLCKNANG